MTFQELIQQVEQLSESEKQQLLEKLQIDLKVAKLAKLHALAGQAKGIWNQDAQEHIDHLRADDRF